MLLRPLRHIRNNLVGYISLFVALGGTSYAAFSLPPEASALRSSRTARSRRRRSTQTSVAANVRAWATLPWFGMWKIQASTSDIHVDAHCGGW